MNPINFFQKKNVKLSDAAPGVHSSAGLGSKKDSEDYGWKLINLASSFLDVTDALIRKTSLLQESVADSLEDPVEKKRVKLKLIRERNEHDQSMRKHLEYVAMLTRRSS